MSTTGRVTSPHAGESSVDRVADLVESVKVYAIQETVGPIKGAGRWLAYGSLASLCLGVSVVMMGLGVLRLSQDLGGSVLDGSWSFVHYLVTSVVLSLAVWGAMSRIRRTSLAKEKS
mgnify:CR=1 FL=1